MRIVTEVTELQPHGVAVIVAPNLLRAARFVVEPQGFAAPGVAFAFTHRADMGAECGAHLRPRLEAVLWEALAEVCPGPGVGTGGRRPRLRNAHLMA